MSWRNSGVVESGRLYRSNQPLPWQVRDARAPARAKTVVNLRGERIECGSDRLGRAAAAQLGPGACGRALQSRGAPHKDRILRLAEIFRSMPEPVLIHCKSGADRTGLAAGLWLLLQGRPVGAGAGAVLAPPRPYPQGRPASWTPSSSATRRLRARRAKPFLDWLREDYDEAALKRDFQSKPWADRLVDGILRRE